MGLSGNQPSISRRTEDGYLFHQSTCRAASQPTTIVGYPTSVVSQMMAVVDQLAAVGFNVVLAKTKKLAR